MSESAINLSLPRTSSSKRVSDCDVSIPLWNDAFPFFLSSATKCSFATDQTIFDEGDDTRDFYYVVSGGVRLVKLHPGGQRQVLSFSLQDGIFGLEYENARRLTAEALCATKLLKCSRAAAIADDGMKNILISIVSREIAAAQDHVILLGQYSARERVASFLLGFGREPLGADAKSLRLPMSRPDIADYLGLTVETVSRQVATLRRSGIIATPGRDRIVVKEIAALRAIAAGQKA